MVMLTRLFRRPSWSSFRQRFQRLSQYRIAALAKPLSKSREAVSYLVIENIENLDVAKPSASSYFGSAIAQDPVINQQPKLVPISNFSVYFPLVE